MALSPGTRVGPYEVIAAIGAGGMGEVYRARDRKLGREVALKVLPALFAGDHDRLARFQREAEVLAALNHPHIAHIHGLEESDGVRALVLELVEGPTLADRIAEGPIAFDEASPVARQIAEALEAAHEQGIIHRDLKPANIKLRPDGTVKVLDFGLAKALEGTGAGQAGSPGEGGRLNSPTITSPALMTAAGVILGTAAYMSPEQAKGREADRRSDIWAFGCVLYEMLTGRRAFDGEDVADTLALVLKGEPDWTAIPASTPRVVRTLVRRCLERDPRRRVADISTARFVFDEPVSAETAEPGKDTAYVQAQVAAAVADARRRLLRHRVLPAAAALLVAAIGAGVAAWRLRASPPPPAVAQFSWTLPEGQAFAVPARGIVALSNDGAQLAYVASNRLFLRAFSDLEARPIPGSDLGTPINSPVFSPDNRWLAFHHPADGTIKRVSVAGGAPVTVCAVDLPFGMTWDPSGVLVGQGDKGIVRCTASGGAAEQLATVKDGEIAFGPQLLPGARALLFTVARTADGPTLWEKPQVVVQSLGTGERTTIVAEGSDARYLPTGHVVYAVSGVVFAVPFNPARQTVMGDAVPVIEGVRRGRSSGVAHFATSGTGTLAYIPGGVRTSYLGQVLALGDRAGATTRLPVAPGAYEHVRVSRDGKQLAVGTNDGKEAIVWVYELGGSRAMQRLTLEGRNRYPIWSPDGQHVAFQSDREGDLAIFSQRADGTGAAERLTKPEPGEAHVPESWSPDARHIAFCVVKDGRFSLWTLSLEARKAMPYAGIQSEEPPNAVFSPDGRWIAFSRGPRGGASSPNRGVFVQPFPAASAIYQIPKQGLDFHPVWTAGGNEIVWIPSVASGRLAAVTLTTRPNVTFGTPVTFPATVSFSRPSGSVRVYDILPDGRFVGLVPGSDVAQQDLVSELRVVLNWFEELKHRVPIP
jgi:serine/threonine-protein kinase